MNCSLPSITSVRMIHICQYRFGKLSEVTTPHSFKLGASGVTLVCRPIPSFVSTTEARHGSKQLLSRLARADVWYASAFTRGSLPRNLQTLLSCQCAKRTTAPFFLRVQIAESVFPPVGCRLFIPFRERRGLLAWRGEICVQAMGKKTYR
jgi:hypothetical protein